jgi:poly(A) polymerase
MLRAVALAARLNFTIDPPVLAAIRAHCHEISHSSAPRLLEEYYKILRAGSAEKTFRMLADLGLLEPISDELHRGASDPLWRSLARLDAYRAQFESTPDTLTNAILLGSLLTPLGIPLGSGRPKEEAPKLGALPLARRDVERLRQIVGLQRRLQDVHSSPRSQRSLAHRGLFPEALTWFEIQGGDRDTLEKWRGVIAQGPVEGEALPPEGPFTRRRRRRRRRRRPMRPVQS